VSAQPIVIEWKRGDFFSVACQYRDDAGVNTDFTALGISVRSQVRRPDGRLVAELAVASGATGAYLLEQTTADWPLGDLLWDIQYTLATKPFSTQNMTIRVFRGATEPN
jgi:hypothetical protein